jgi:glycosyltransferase involved in cell wall biosynthesis
VLDKILIISTDNIQNLNIRSPLSQMLLKKFSQVISVGDRETNLQHEIKWHGSMSRNGFLGEFAVFFRLAKILHAEKASHIISFSPKGNIYVGLFSLFLSFKHIAVITGFGKYSKVFRKDNKFIKIILGIVFVRAKLIITMNQDNSIFLKGVTNTPVEKINSEGFQSPVGSGLKKDGPPDEFRILYLSRLIEEKGILILLDAIAKVAASGRNVCLNIAGEMGLSQHGQDVLKEYIDNDRINYLGKVTEQKKNQLFMESELYALPSVYGEGLPMTLLEAQYYGCMVLTTGAAGCIDALAPENLSSAVAYSSDAIAEKINEMYDAYKNKTNAPEYFSLRKDARDWVINNHSINKILEDYSYVFQKLKVFE